MARDVSLENLVTLPRLNAYSAMALGEQLLSAAEAEAGEGGLPLPIERPRIRLRTAVGGLKVELEPQESANSMAAVISDRILDRGWHSLSAWSEGLAGLPPEELSDVDQIHSLNSTVFSEGLSFVNLPHREEWGQSETRLNAIRKGGFEPLIERLGGAPFLAHLRKAHQEYGKVLGITQPLKIEENPKIRVHLQKLAEALRDYVLKVAAYAEPDEPGSEELSTALLAPFTGWEDSFPDRSSETTDEATDETTAGAGTAASD